MFHGADIARGKRVPKPRQTRTARQSLFQQLTTDPTTRLKHPRLRGPTAATGRPKYVAPEIPLPATSEHDYVKTRPIFACPTQVEALTHEVLNLQEEVDSLKSRTLSLYTVTHFRRWTNLPNREVFDALSTYLKKRGGERLKYWRGQETNKSRHFLDAGLQNKPGPSRRLSFDEELFMVLVKLKTGLNSAELEQLFGVSQTVVGQIHTTYLNFLYGELKLLFEMADLEDDKGVAECYKDFPNLKVRD